MRVGIVTIPRLSASGSQAPVIEQVCNLARKVEELGFHGLWLTDAFARGRATLDPYGLLGALCAVTSRIELGTCVVQVPIRHPVEHAHRVQTINLLSNGRLRLGVGSGSTKHDFDAVEANYDTRFKVLPGMLDVMKKVWAEQPVYGPALSVWPGTEGGPPMLLGAWRSPRWINLAANVCQGWIASGIHSSPEDVEIGIKMYREAGGKRAVLANIFTDLRPNAEPIAIGHTPKITLMCAPAEAKDRLKRLEQTGLDDALLVCPFDDPNQLEAIRALVP